MVNGACGYLHLLMGDAIQKKIALALRLYCGTMLYNLTEVVGLRGFLIAILFFLNCMADCKCHSFIEEQNEATLTLEIVL